MIKWLKKKKYTEVISCVEGILVPLKEINDPVFSNGALGRGVAIKPKSSKIVSPVDGIVQVIFPTNHAVGMVTSDGLEFLIHIGINTVKLKGEGFKRVVSERQKVRKGDVLIEVDFNLLDKEGYSTDTMVILTTDEMAAEFIETCPYGTFVDGKEQSVFKCCMK